MPPVGKIAQLPDEIRAWLHQAIVERSYGDIVGLTEELNALCKAGGVAISVGKSAVGAESLKVKRAQESIRATTEAAKLIASTARDDGDSRSEAAMALVQSQMFELLLQVREAEATEDPHERIEIMGKAALSLSRISRANVTRSRWKDELDQRAKAAADAVAKIARKGGLTPEQQAEIRSSILGIARRDPPPAAAS